MGDAGNPARPRPFVRPGRPVRANTTAPSGPARAPGGRSRRGPGLAAPDSFEPDAPSSAAPHREAQDDDAAFLRTPSRHGVPAPPPAAVQLRYRRYPPADRGAGDRAALSSARDRKSVG